MAWIGAIAAVGGSILSSEMSKGAAGAQGGATEAAIAAQRAQDAQTREDQAPWRVQGTNAINRLGVLLGLQKNALPSIRDEDFQAPGTGTGTNQRFVRVPNTLGTPYADMWHDTVSGRNYNFQDKAIRDAEAESTTPPDAGYGDLTKKFTLADFWDDPVTKASYQQGLDQGTKALRNMAGAAGNRNSGAQLKALERFSTDYTGNQAGQSQARFESNKTNDFNRFATVAGLGQTAANTVAASGTNTANTIGGLLTAQGNARGAASIAGGQQIGGALTNAGNWYNQNQTLNRLLGNTASPTSNFTYSGYDSMGGPAYG